MMIQNGLGGLLELMISDTNDDLAAVGSSFVEALEESGWLLTPPDARIVKRALTRVAAAADTSIRSSQGAPSRGPHPRQPLNVSLSA
jgi:hypothetical protein